eukprot:scaffold671621_cov57-Prasinocladus_malaysianus.AAC.1
MEGFCPVPTVGDKKKQEGDISLRYKHRTISLLGCRETVADFHTYPYSYQLGGGTALPLTCGAP